MTTTIYGIKNCDTMKKALNWLTEHSIDFTFVDYKKQGVDEDILRAAINEHGWETVINKRGTTWRALPEDVKNSMDIEGAIKIAHDSPSIIKRPLLIHKGNIHMGFKSELYSEVFS